MNYKNCCQCGQYLDECECDMMLLGSQKVNLLNGTILLFQRGREHYSEFWPYRFAADMCESAQMLVRDGWVLVTVACSALCTMPECAGRWLDLGWEGRAVVLGLSRAGV